MQFIRHIHPRIAVKAAVILEVDDRLARRPVWVGAAVHFHRDDVLRPVVRDLPAHIDRERREAPDVAQLFHAVDPHLRGLHRGFEFDVHFPPLVIGIDGKVLAIPADPKISGGILRRYVFGRMRKVDIRPGGIVECVGIRAACIPGGIFPIKVEIQLDPSAQRRKRRAHCGGRRGYGGNW